MFKNDFDYLNQFVGHKVEMFYHSQSKPLSTTFNYQRFKWYIEDNELFITDDNEPNNITTVNVHEIDDIKNLTNNLYTTVVDIITNDYTISISCTEEVCKCHKCKTEIHINNTKWIIVGSPNYDSYYDSVGNILENKIKEFAFCDNCIHDFLGDISKDGEYNE